MKAHAGIGAVIKRLRKEKGWTQPQLASRVGIHQSNITRLERGKQNLDAENLKAVAHALGRTVTQLHALAGIETPEFSRPSLSDEEAEVLDLYRRLGEYDQVTVKRLLVCFSGLTRRKARRA